MKLIVFKQDNCTPCNMLNDALKELGTSIDAVDRVANLTSGSDEDLMLAGIHAIEKTPTMVLVEDDFEGEAIDKYQGVGRKNVTRILTQRGLI